MAFKYIPCNYERTQGVYLIVINSDDISTFHVKEEDIIIKDDLEGFVKALEWDHMGELTRVLINDAYMRRPIPVDVPTTEIKEEPC